MTVNNGLTRRRFIKKAAVSTAAVSAVFPSIIPSTALGAYGSEAPGNRITLGFIGMGGQGRFLLKKFLAKKDAHIS